MTHSDFDSPAPLNERVRASTSPPPAATGREEKKRGGGGGRNRRRGRGKGGWEEKERKKTKGKGGGRGNRKGKQKHNQKRPSVNFTPKKQGINQSYQTISWLPTVAVRHPFQGHPRREVEWKEMPASPRRPPTKQPPRNHAVMEALVRNWNGLAAHDDTYIGEARTSVVPPLPDTNKNPQAASTSASPTTSSSAAARIVRFEQFVDTPIVRTPR